MHSHNEASSNQSNSGFILRHLLLLIIALVLLGGLYIESQNMTIVGSTAILLVLAHLGALAIILYGGRSILRAIIQKIRLYRK